MKFLKLEVFNRTIANWLQNGWRIYGFKAAGNRLELTLKHDKDEYVWRMVYFSESSEYELFDDLIPAAE